MKKVFNVTGACNPVQHYMVDISKRLADIKTLVDSGAYFTINRARQYGKTTTLEALQQYLSDEYTVVYLDFQFLSDSIFENEASFVREFADELCDEAQLPVNIEEKLSNLSSNKDITANLRVLFKILSEWCMDSEKPIVLIIDEVDSATNNQVFLDFLAQLRGYYLRRTKKPTFKSVILAGVYDVKNIKHKISPYDQRKRNSPWNTHVSNEESGSLLTFDECSWNHMAQPYDIAADFDVVMSLSRDGIEGMLLDYEADNHTGMDTTEIASMLYDYTEGYPFLVSRLCKIIDEKLDKQWTTQGFLEAVKLILIEKNTLFESLIGKLLDYPSLEKTINKILFAGEKIVYNPDDTEVDIAQMFGFIKNNNGSIAIANRIFEMRLYNYFLTTNAAQDSLIFKASANDKSQYINDGRLNMEHVLSKYVEHFNDIYGDCTDSFDEEEGRRRFLLYIRPIINGTGNYYIEARTRNARRMDVVVDYKGERFVIELKIWHGDAYNKRGEQQLADYLDYFKLKKGFMLSYNFNKNKTVGLNEIHLGDRILVEAVV
jgi:hypothetical protein